jgi:FAD binding domain-containing protein/berberine-like enzyme
VTTGRLRASQARGDTGDRSVSLGRVWGDLYRALAQQGRAIPGGCGPTVGVSGLTLGGGLGVLGRMYGLTCDSLTGATVVLADGRTVECDAQHDADLFWALRGGAPDRLGVVTALRFTTVPAPVCTVLDISWDFEHAAALLDAWQWWAPEAPDALAASLVATAPADPRRAPRVTVFGVWAGGERAASELIEELIGRVGVAPRSAWREQLEWLATKQTLNDRAPGEGDDGDMYQRSEFFAQPLPKDAIGELLGHFASDRTCGATRELDLTPWGAAYTRVGAEATAFPHRTARFLLKHSTVLANDAAPAARDHACRWLERSWSMVRPWGTGGVYPNFPDPALEDPGRAYHGANHERLSRIQSAYDPAGLFRAVARQPDLPGDH